LFYLCRFHSDMATCRPTLFLLTVKEILLVHFIITNFRVAHKMLCTPRLRNPLTTSRLSCPGRKAALTTIFLSVRQSRISQPCYTNNYFSAPKASKIGDRQVLVEPTMALLWRPLDVLLFRRPKNIFFITFSTVWDIEL
jgi:hypothetical protein